MLRGKLGQRAVEREQRHHHTVIEEAARPFMQAVLKSEAARQAQLPPLQSSTAFDASGGNGGQHPRLLS